MTSGGRSSSRRDGSWTSGKSWFRFWGLPLLRFRSGPVLAAKSADVGSVSPGGSEDLADYDCCIPLIHSNDPGCGESTVGVPGSRNDPLKMHMKGPRDAATIHHRFVGEIYLEDSLL